MGAAANKAFVPSASRVAERACGAPWRTLRRQRASGTNYLGAGGLENWRHTRRCRYVTCSAAQPSNVEETVDAKKEVKVVLPKVVPVTVISGSDEHLKKQVVSGLLGALKNQRVTVLYTEEDSSVAHEPYREAAEDNGTQAPEDTDAREEPAEEEPQPQNGTTKKGTVAISKDAATAGLEDWRLCVNFNDAVETMEQVSLDREHCDYILLLTGGEVIDLKDIAQAIMGTQTTKVDSMVTIVNAATFMDDMLMSSEGTGVPENPEHSNYKSATRLVYFVENANVVVLCNPGGELSEASVAEVQALVHSLNTSATLLKTNDNRISPEAVVGISVFDPESFDTAASWKRVFIAAREAAMDEDGKAARHLSKAVRESTFLYCGKRPFHPQRLYNLVKDMRTFSGVLKSIGKLWLATRMSYPLTWNQAGGTITLKQGDPFWVTIPEDQWPSDMRDMLLSKWDERFGDRESEIVFVGPHLDRTKLQGLLDSCLLQDEEMVFSTSWESFEDPFVVFVPREAEEPESADEEDETEPEGTDAKAETVQAESTEEDRAAEEESSSRSDGAGVEALAAEQADEGAPSTADENGSVRLQGDGSETEKQVSKGGTVDVESAPSALMERVSELDANIESDLGLKLNPGRRAPDTEDVVLASGDSHDADQILNQIPNRGLPVTLITGFLGSGKTSLVNYILTQDHGLKIAVLVNEFGEIDIDSQLVDSEWQDDETLLLNNGCICCSINDSFVDAVYRILDHSHQTDYLIVETSGVADPVPIVNSLMSAELEEMVYVDSIVTLVDAEQFDAERNLDSEAALSQIAVADVVLVSKTDIAEEEDVDQLVKFVNTLRPGARILRSQHGAVPLEMILNVKPKDRSSWKVDKSDEKRAVSDAEDHSAHDHEHGEDCNHDHDHHHDHHHDHDHSHDHSHGHDRGDFRSSHLETDGFMSVSFRCDEPFDLDLFFTKFLELLPAGVFRSKGLLYFKGYDKRYCFQLSGRRYRFEDDDWPEGSTRSSQIVVIGRNLDVEKMKGMLKSCCVSRD